VPEERKLVVGLRAEGSCAAQKNSGSRKKKEEARGGCGEKNGLGKRSDGPDVKVQSESLKPGDAKRGV